MEVDDEETKGENNEIKNKKKEEKRSREKNEDEDEVPLKNMKTQDQQERLSKSSSNKYSPAKSCPFPGCDGSGNVKKTSSVHFSLKACPLARDEKKREKELLVRNYFYNFYFL